MAIDTAGLLALKGNLIVGIKTTKSYSMKDLVRLKKAITDGVYDESYDMNSDGILDDTDVSILSDIVINNLFP